MTMDSNEIDLETLLCVIARSPIRVPAKQRCRLPEAFDATDIAILDWIMADSRRAARSLTWM